MAIDQQNCLQISSSGTWVIVCIAPQDLSGADGGWYRPDRGYAGCRSLTVAARMFVAARQIFNRAATVTERHVPLTVTVGIWIAERFPANVENPRVYLETYSEVTLT